MNRLRAMVVWACALSAAAFAGPLDPPVGPIAPTQKPLAEIEPRVAINDANTPGDGISVFRITQPGSYYLTRNILANTSQNGILIESSDVTLDLNGFELVGMNVNARDGVKVTIFQGRNITVKNGTVRNWGGEGIDFGSANVRDARVERVTARLNIGTGIFVNSHTAIVGCTSSFNGANGIGAGDSCFITDCVVANNSDNGIATGARCLITRCQVADNSGSGVVLGARSNLIDSVISGNGGAGVIGGQFSTISDCSVTLSFASGVLVDSHSIVRDNNVSDNCTSGAGANIFVSGSDSRIDGNHCNDAARGIQVTTNSTGNFILRNTCANNTINYDIVANNRYGPIINLTGGGTPGVVGNTAADTSGTTHPWANFAY